MNGLSAHRRLACRAVRAIAGASSLAAALLLAGCAKDASPAPAEAASATQSAAPSTRPRVRLARKEGDFVIPKFNFTDGRVFENLRIHYYTFGTPHRDASGHVDNAVLAMHGTSGSGLSLATPSFSDELFGPGQPLDASTHFIVLPDGIGHGKSSKPSDGEHAKFPQYGYVDMVNAEHALIADGLKVDHLRLVMGTSMGGMHTWLWGEMFPDYMDALLPLASLPTQISGRNRVWRRMVIDSIKNDPDWNGGEYKKPPAGLRVAEEVMWFMGDNPYRRYKAAPTLTAADKAIDAYVDRAMRTTDANDLMYALAASHDYDPEPGLSKIKAPLLAINSADDLINPPDLLILETKIKQVPHGRMVLIPESEATRGHGTHTLAAVWKNYLIEFLKETAK